MRNHIILFCCFLIFSKGYAKPDTVQSHSGADITNGHDAEPMEFPYLVSMQVVGEHFCGGSILNENYILTAAHCTNIFNSTNAHLIKVVAGTINVYEPYETREVEKIIQHEDFQLHLGDPHDISLLKLKSPLTFDSKVQPVKLADADSSIPVGSAVVISGWGLQEGHKSEEETPTILQTTTVYVALQSYCKIVLALRQINLSSKSVCAFNPFIRKGECNGDSGGPLTLNGIQVGIASFGIKDPVCGSTTFPGVYTRVAEYIDWINENAV